MSKIGVREDRPVGRGGLRVLNARGEPQRVKPWAERSIFYQAFTVMLGAALFAAFIRFCFILYGYDDPELRVEDVQAMMQAIGAD